MGRYEEIKAVFDKFKAAYEEIEKIAREEGMSYVDLDMVISESGNAHRFPSFHKDGVRYINYIDEIHVVTDNDEFTVLREGEDDGYAV